MAGSRTILLLQIEFAPFKASGIAINTCLPGWCAQVFDGTLGTIVEDILHFFKRLLAGLGEDEEDVNEHSHAEDTEDYVDLPSDICESGRHKICESEVECPVRGGCQSDCLSSDAERVQFWRIDPRDWAPGRCI